MGSETQTCAYNSWAKEALSQAYMDGGGVGRREVATAGSGLVFKVRTAGHCVQEADDTSFLQCPDSVLEEV